MLKALDLPAQPFDLVYRLANEAQVTPPVGADAIEEGWKEQRHGIVQKGERERSDWITKTLLAFEPTTEKEKIIHTETVRQAAHRIELSRARLLNVGRGLPRWHTKTCRWRSVGAL